MFLLPLKTIVLCTTLFLILHTLLNLLSPRVGVGGDWKHFEGKRSTFAKPPFTLNIYFHDVSLKNCSILFAKQNKSGSENSDSSLKQGWKNEQFFVLNRLRVWRPRRYSSFHTSLKCAPPPPFSGLPVSSNLNVRPEFCSFGIIHRGGSRIFFQEGVHSSLALLQHQ